MPSLSTQWRRSGRPAMDSITNFFANLQKQREQDELYETFRNAANSFLKGQQSLSEGFDPNDNTVVEGEDGINDLMLGDYIPKTVTNPNTGREVASPERYQRGGQMIGNFYKDLIPLIMNQSTDPQIMQKANILGSIFSNQVEQMKPVEKKLNLKAFNPEDDLYDESTGQLVKRGIPKPEETDNLLLPELSTNEADYYGKRVPGPAPEENMTQSEDVNGLVDFLLGDANQTNYQISKKDYKPKYTQSGEGGGSGGGSRTGGKGGGDVDYDYSKLYTSIQSGLKDIRKLKDVKLSKQKDDEGKETGRLEYFEPGSSTSLVFENQDEFNKYKEAKKGEYVEDAYELLVRIGLDGPEANTATKNIREQMKKGYSFKEAIEAFKEANPDFPENAVNIMESYFELSNL